MNRLTPPLMLVGPLALAAAVVLFAIADHDITATPPNGESVVVQAVDNAFAPVDQTIVAGTEIVWVNRGRNDHNIIPENRDPRWLVEDIAFKPGDEASFVFDTPGTYLYYCSIHGNLTAGMPGVIVVTAAT